MASVAYPVAPDENVELLIAEARRRQRLRWAAGAVLLAAALGVGVFFGTGGGSGSSGQPASNGVAGSEAMSVVQVTESPRPVIGAMTVMVSTQRRLGEAIRPMITDQGLLLNQGRKSVYIDGRPLILTLRPLLPQQRLGSPSYYVLRAPRRFHLAGVFVSGSRSVFVVATTKRPPSSSRNVPGRRIAVWYSMDGGAHWQTNIDTITEASPANALRAVVPSVRGADAKTAVTALLEHGLIPRVELVRCPSCTSGRVVKQTPASGHAATRWSQVSIQMAR
jgi:hypothetical protein